jgi:hypothetical protein
MYREDQLQQEFIYTQFDNTPPEPPPTQVVADPGGAITGLTSNTLVVGGKTGTLQNVEAPQPLGTGAAPTFVALTLAQASLSALGKLLLPAGIGVSPSTDRISNLGTYIADPADRATAANTTETDFTSKTVSANVFAADGDLMLVCSSVQFAANANSKRYRLYFGANVIFDTTSQPFNNVRHFLLGLLMRKSSSSLHSAFVQLFPGFATGFDTQFVTTGGLNFATSNILKSTGQNAVAAANDITQPMFVALKGSV